MRGYVGLEAWGLAFSFLALLPMEFNTHRFAGWEISISSIPNLLPLGFIICIQDFDFLDTFYIYFSTVCNYVWKSLLKACSTKGKLCLTTQQCLTEWCGYGCCCYMCSCSLQVWWAVNCGNRIFVSNVKDIELKKKNFFIFQEREGVTEEIKMDLGNFIFKAVFYIM